MPQRGLKLRKGDAKMVWKVWFLVSGPLILASLGTWCAYSLQRRRAKVVREHQEWMSVGGGEFVGFLANPDASHRGGMVVQASRAKLRCGLVEKMAQAEVNRFLRTEIAGRDPRKPQNGSRVNHTCDSDSGFNR